MRLKNRQTKIKTDSGNGLGIRGKVISPTNPVSDGLPRIAAGANFRQKFNLTRPAGLPDRIYRDAMKASAGLRRHEEKTLEAYRDKADRINNEYLRRLHATIGARNMPKYLEFRKQSKGAMRAARRKLVQPGRGRTEFDKLRRAQVSKSLVFMKNLGIGVNRIRRLQDEFQKKRNILFEKAVGRKQVPKPLPRKKNQTFKPPFDGSLTWRYWYFYKEDSTDRLYSYSQQGIKYYGPSIVWGAEEGGPDPSTGAIGFRKTIGLEDASDHDEFQVWAIGGVLKWFKVPPPGGNVTVRIRAKIGATSGNSGSVYDESGDSSLSLRQIMRFYARVNTVALARRYAPPTLVPSKAKEWSVFDYIDEDQDSHNWSNGGWVGGLAPGVTKDFGPVIIPGSHSAGDWVIVEAGLTYNNLFYADDDEVRSDVNTNACITELGLNVSEFGEL